MNTLFDILPFISKEELAKLKWETAEQWLTEQTYGDNMGIQALMETASFWTWWENQWQIVDRAFVKEHARYLYMNDADSKALLLSLYKEAHNAEGMTIQLGREQLDQAYNLLVGKMWKQQHSITAKKSPMTNEQIFRLNAARLAFEKEIMRITGKAATVSFAIAEDVEHNPSIKQVVDKVCEVVKVNKADVFSLSRKRELADARTMIIQVISVMNPGLTQMDMARIIGRDRTTVLHMLQNHQSLMDAVESYRTLFHDIVAALGISALFVKTT